MFVVLFVAETDSYKIGTRRYMVIHRYRRCPANPADGPEKSRNWRTPQSLSPSNFWTWLLHRIQGGRWSLSCVVWLAAAARFRSYGRPHPGFQLSVSRTVGWPACFHMSVATCTSVH